MEFSLGIFEGSLTAQVLTTAAAFEPEANPPFFLEPVKGPKEIHWEQILFPWVSTGVAMLSLC